MLFGGLYPARGKAIAIASGDYKSVDPAAVTVNCKGAQSLRIAVDPTAVSGSGCTATLTVSGVNDDASATLYTLGTLVVTATGAHEIVVDPRVPFSNSPSGVVQFIQEPLPEVVSIAVVGSGTRTTLTYSVEVEVGA